MDSGWSLLQYLPTKKLKIRPGVCWLSTGWSRIAPSLSGIQMFTNRLYPVMPRSQGHRWNHPIQNTRPLYPIPRRRRKRKVRRQRGKKISWRLGSCSTSCSPALGAFPCYSGTKVCPVLVRRMPKRPGLCGICLWEWRPAYIRWLPSRKRAGNCIPIKLC